MKNKDLTIEEIFGKKDMKEVMALGLENIVRAFNNSNYVLVYESDNKGNVTDLYFTKDENKTK